MTVLKCMQGMVLLWIKQGTRMFSHLFFFFYRSRRDVLLLPLVPT